MQFSNLYIICDRDRKTWRNIWTQCASKENNTIYKKNPPKFYYSLVRKGVNFEFIFGKKMSLN